MKTNFRLNESDKLNGWRGQINAHALAIQEIASRMMPDLRYVNQVMKLRCFRDFLDWELFTNCKDPIKEITESMGMYQSIRQVWQRYEWLRPDNPRVLCVVIGDGSTPRTGALFACMSKWLVVSIDPMLQARWCGPHSIQRLSAHKSTVGEFVQSHPQLNEPVDGVVIVSPHSHVPIDEIKSLVALCVPKPTLLSILPCCVTQKFNEYTQVTTYRDAAILSPKNEIMVYET